MTQTITYEDTLPDIDEYWKLYATTGWNERYHFTKADLLKANTNSWYAVTVFEDEKLIGFGRVISDGIYHALIADMIVLPEYRGEGIGSNILDKLVKKCLENKIRDIQLFPTEQTYGFYEKYNFVKRPDTAPGMRYKQEEIDNLKKAGWHF